MKCYAEKNFDKEFLKTVDIQNVGVYFDIPIKDLTPSFRDEFDFDNSEKEQGTMLLDYHTIYNNDEYVETYENIEYNYTDSFEIDEFFARQYEMREDYGN